MLPEKYFLCEYWHLEFKDNPSHKVLLVCPEKLENVKADDLWNRMLSTFGKFEIETWLAENICDIAKEAAKNGETFADLSRISQAMIFYDNEVQRTSRDFLKKFCKLPIFMIKKDTEDVTVLEFKP